ncbi:GIN domain-containing protein [Pedobacter flavus]|uniref:DUF2807 domain-containing protein n=1 Tax=Pedobacter flavus TaxID=3113906 RepID=A0ABU7GZN2_9SPHI|nr:DUF2807 domain-containing protein [Pedobacter sp. VNH31]MEE1884451.1 DUF2807 domain-containing protein [Pedobacter sp. VNH31]
MKTSIKSIIAIALTALTLTTASASNKVTVLKEVKNFNALNVSGNVEIILVQSNEEKVQVYNNYYENNALVQTKDGVLNISSYDDETLTVVVNFKKLSKITASDDASISNIGKISALGLDINLKNNSKAALNLNTIELSTKMNGNSVLYLEGSSLNYRSSVQNLASINLNKFDSESISFSSKNTRYASILDENDLQNLGK